MGTESSEVLSPLYQRGGFSAGSGIVSRGTERHFEAQTVGMTRLGGAYRDLITVGLGLLYVGLALR